METEDKKDMVKEIDDALRFLEEDEALSASDIDYMMADAEARTVVSDLLDSKQAAVRLLLVCCVLMWIASGNSLLPVILPSLNILSIPSTL